MVDMKTPGLTLVTRYKTMMGEEPWHITFDDMKIPAENIVGKEGEGFKLAQKWLGIGRLKHGARALGVAERCIHQCRRDRAVPRRGFCRGRAPRGLLPAGERCARPRGRAGVAPRCARQRRD
jgi:acyl-CoA dehydrogenase